MNTTKLRRACGIAALALLTIISTATADVFSDDFNRADAPTVGNGWVDAPTIPGSTLILRNGRVAAPNTTGPASILRPFDSSQPVRIRATLFEREGGGGTTGRFESALMVRGDGGNGRGYGITVARSDSLHNNSVVGLVDNSASWDEIYVARQSPPFQFTSPLSVDVTILPDGAVNGSIQCGSNRWSFAFGPRAIAASGPNFVFSTTLTGGSRPDRMDNFRIEHLPVFDRLVAFDTDHAISILNPVDGNTATIPIAVSSVQQRPDWSRDGELIAFNGGAGGNSQIYVVAPDGSGLRRVTGGSGDLTAPAFSPDGGRIAYEQANGTLRVIHADGTGENNLGLPGASASWSPTGAKIAYHENGSFAPAFDIITYDLGTLATTTLTNANSVDYFQQPAWSPDGTKIALIKGTNSGGSRTDVWVMNADGTGMVNLTPDWATSNEGEPAWSPDGNFIVFESNRTGNTDIWVMRADGTCRVNLTNTPGINEHNPTVGPIVPPGPDNDDDGIPDATDPDDDNDGVTDDDEVANGTDPFDPDSDDDGADDGQEAATGTDPLDSDTDDDGLFDGTENTIGTDPLDDDSDDDGLADGFEVGIGTDPLNADTDGDDVPDALDPMPTIPGVPANFIEFLLRALCDEIQAMPLAAFDAKNDNARAGHRNALANKVCAAANAVRDGRFVEAVEKLNDDVLKKVDGLPSPGDFMVASAEKTHVSEQVILALALLAYFF